jgi:hypothetical protein
MSLLVLALLAWLIVLPVGVLALAILLTIAAPQRSPEPGRLVSLSRRLGDVIPLYPARQRPAAPRWPHIRSDRTAPTLTAPRSRSNACPASRSALRRTRGP